MGVALANLESRFRDGAILIVENLEHLNWPEKIACFLGIHHFTCPHAVLQAAVMNSLLKGLPPEACLYSVRTECTASHWSIICLCTLAQSIILLQLTAQWD